MSFLILVRHGQSIWNLEKKFTGWVDIELTEQGKLEAKNAGFLIKKPAFSASNLPLSVRSTSTQPVNFFSRFQIL